MSLAKKTTAKKAAKKTAVKKAAKKTTKKVAKKSVKKAAKKSTAKKTAEKKPLVVADNERAFWVRNGMVLDSLLALKEAFDEMEREVFQYHVRPEQNDFAVWVSEVLCDDACAAALHKAKTPKTAQTVVVKHLKYYVV